MRKRSKAPAEVVVEEPTATHTLRFEEPLDQWLSSDNAAEHAALKVLADHGITVIEEFGGAGVGSWDTDSHETGFVISTDDTTATKMAGLIQAEIGYPVTVEEELASAEALDALRAKLNGDQEVDDSELSTDWMAWLNGRVDARAMHPAGKRKRKQQIRSERDVADLINRFEDRLLAVAEAEFDSAMLILEGRRS